VRGAPFFACATVVQPGARLRGYSSTNTRAFDISLLIQTRVNISTIFKSITGKPRLWILLPSASFSPCRSRMAETSYFEHMGLHSGDTCTSDFSKLSCPVSCEVTVQKSLAQVIYFRQSTGANCQIVPFLDLSQNLQGYSSTNTCAFDKSLRIQTRVDLSTLCASITCKSQPWILLPSASFSPCSLKGQNRSF